jgi:hypothetical protein
MLVFRKRIFIYVVVTYEILEEILSYRSEYIREVRQHFPHHTE